MDHIDADDLSELQRAHAMLKHLSDEHGRLAIQERAVRKQRESIETQHDAASEQVLALNKRLQAKYGISETHRVNLETGEIVE